MNANPPNTIANNKPLEIIRDGALKATIWENEGENGVLYSTTLARIVRNNVFAANVLAQDQSELASAFASPATPHESRFELGQWAEGPGGPTLSGAVAHFDCRLAHVHDYGSHTIVIGEVIDAMSHDARPLIYAEQAFHKLP